jgi:hypothetical protein
MRTKSQLVCAWVGNVRCDVYAALNRGLKGALYSEAARKVIPERRQRDRLLLL